MTEDSLSSRIRSEAAIADRPGQYARLMQIAHELDALAHEGPSGQAVLESLFTKEDES